MPKLIYPFVESGETILRPVVYQILDVIKRRTKMEYAVSILYPGHTDEALQPNSSIDDKSGKDEVRLDHYGQLKIDVSEEMIGDHLLSTQQALDQNYCIFLDESVNTAIRPVYTEHEVTINVTYRATDKPTAERWRDNIKNAYRMGQEAQYITLNYHYIIPQWYFNILAEIYTLREKQGGYGDTFRGWWDKYKNERCVWVTDQAGKNGYWGVAEAQGQVSLYYGFTGVPDKPEREGEGENFTITFDVKFRYFKPMEAMIDYPPIIHNQVVDRGLIPSNKELAKMDPYMQQRELSNSVYFNEAFNSDILAIGYNTRAGMHTPSFDLWAPSSVVEYSMRIWSTWVMVDPNQLRTCMQYKDIPNIKYDDDVYRFLLSEWKWITVPYKSVFSLTLYVNDLPMKPQKFQVDADGNVSTLFDMDIRGRYHLRLGLITDFSKLDPAAVERIRKDGPAAVKIIDWIDPTIKHYPGLPTINPDGTISKPDWHDTTKPINPGYQGIVGPDWKWPLVQFLTVQEEEQDADL